MSSFYFCDKTAPNVSGIQFKNWFEIETKMHGHANVCAPIILLFDEGLKHHQGDQIGRFFTIWALFEALGGANFFSKIWSLYLSLQLCWRQCVPV